MRPAHLSLLLLAAHAFAQAPAADDKTLYFQSLDRGGTLGTIHCGAVTIDVPATSAYVDNALEIKNFSGGYSAISFYRPTDRWPGGGAIGMGPATSPYPGLYIATNPHTTVTDDPPEIVISQEKQDTNVFRAHRRLYFDGTAHTITAYGWADAVAGPICWIAGSDGKLTTGENGTPVARRRHGRVTLVAGAATVSDPFVTSETEIHLTVQSLGTVTRPKALGVTARIPAASFTITSEDPADTSVVAWETIEP